MMSTTMKVALAVLIVCQLAFGQDCPTPSAPLKAMTDKGCFSSSGSLQDQGQNGFQSPGKCQCFCVNLGKPVMATSGGTNCWCGDLIPATSSKVDSGQCNAKCNGYDQLKCMYILSLLMFSSKDRFILTIAHRWWRQSMVCLFNRIASQCSK